jgi:hypothetical protein
MTTKMTTKMTTLLQPMMIIRKRKHDLVANAVAAGSLAQELRMTATKILKMSRRKVLSKKRTSRKSVRGELKTTGTTYPPGNRPCRPLLRQTSEALVMHMVEVLAVAEVLRERAKMVSDHLDVADVAVRTTVIKRATDLGEFGFKHEPERVGVIL